MSLRPLLLTALAALAAAAPAEPLVEMAVTRRAVVGVSAWDLHLQGIDLGAPPIGELGVTNMGIPVASTVEDLDGNGLFDGSDRIVFFGQTARDGDIYRYRYADKNVYILERWPEVERPAMPELRPAALGPARPIGDSPVSFQRSIHIEEDVSWGERFATWEQVSTDFSFMTHLSFLHIAERLMKFDAPQVDSDSPSPFTLQLAFFGRSSASRLRYAGLTDHSVRIRLNGHDLGFAEWDGVKGYHATLSGLDPSILRPHGNELLLTLNQRPDVSIDVIYLDWYEVQFPSVPAIIEDQGEFSLPGPSGGQTVSVSGFSSPNVNLFCLTNETVLPVQVSPEPAGTHRVTFTAPIDDALYAISADNALARPTSIETFATAVPSSPDEGYEFVIITHPLFRAAAERLGAYRNEEGLRTLVLDADDIYDAFWHGMPHPDGIREALRHMAQHWPAPHLHYVLLMGDSSWDFHQLASTNPIFIPTHYYYNAEGEFASDSYFSIFEEQGPPQLAIGRLPVKTPDEANQVVDKIIGFERGLATATPDQAEDWRHRIIFAASDNPMYRDFLDQAVGDYIEGNFELQKAYASDESPLDCTQAIVDAFNDGVAFVSYVGHGARYIWQTGTTLARRAQDYEANFSPEWVAELINSPHLPVVFGITCFTNNFDNPDPRNCIGEKLVLSPAGGAIACIATSSYSYVHSDLAFCDLLFESLFETQPQRVGDLLLTALQNGTATTEVREMFLLLGDPASHLPLQPMPGARGIHPRGASEEASAEVTAPVPAGVI